MMNEDWGAGLVGKCRRLEERERKRKWGGRARVGAEWRGLEEFGHHGPKPRPVTFLPQEVVGKCSIPCTPLEFELYYVIYCSPHNPRRNYPSVCFQPLQCRIPCAAPSLAQDCAAVSSQVSSPQVSSNSTILWSGRRSITSSPVPLRGVGSSPIGVAV